VKIRINSLKILLPVCVILFSVIIAPAVTENRPRTGLDKVRILILSKQIRLLKEGKTDHLHFSFPANCEIDTGEKRIPCKNLSISCNDKNLYISAGKSRFDKGDITVYPEDTGETFSVKIDNDSRSYPLPLYIKYSSAEIELSIEETVNRFAVDSALAELGDLPDKHSEALYALAHLVKARCTLPYLADKHKGYNFCDLTCCQTYKGISGKTFNDPVSIKTAGVRNGLFFHSSGGGKLFTDSIFNVNGRITAPPKDLIYSENITLSREKHRSWKASIAEGELAGILYPGKQKFLKEITFNMEKEIMFIETGNGKEMFSPETFRIRVNRVKGWNFLKSNNYLVTRSDGIYNFSGSGLGHGTGMSLEGALQLAERGYSRYEILEHYYPSIEYDITQPSAVSHQLQYIIFDSESGEIIKSSSGVSFRNRIIPCGSIFKLFIALYLAEKRTDLFYNYSYTCGNKEKNKLIPEYCWNKTGHGKMNISSALFNSCNRYFASLYDKIDPEDFRKWITGFTEKNGIALLLPESNDKAGFSNLLAGLDFRSTITIDGIIKLNRFLYTENKEHHREENAIIFAALHKTFTDGTAKETATETIPLPGKINIKDLWGKTGTVIAGTNSHCSYGIFTGGLSSTGIAAILRKGTGAMAAGESKKILLNLE